MSVFALLERLAPYVETEVKLVLNSKEVVDALVDKLEKIQIGLEDAEMQGATDAGVGVKRWLKQIEDVAFEMEDVLDEWEMENLRVELEGSPEEALSNLWEKVRSFFNSLCRCFTHVVDSREIVIKMKALSVRLDAILEEKDWYRFVESATNHSREQFQQPETTSGVPKLQICGRDSDIKSLVERLSSNGGEERGTEVVSIVGHGGVGKTTLAQLVFNHDEVKKHFEVKAWASVPHTFDPLDVGRRILDVFGKDSENVKTLERLASNIREVVAKKKFLLVLDNVWTENIQKWTDLENCLSGAPGSKILVTTRSEGVASMMRSTQHPLHELSDKDCEKILMDEVASLVEGNQNMRDLAVEIAKKCHRLPLAARYVGRMLASKPTELEWQGILKNPLWEHKSEMGELYSFLKLSYFDLSPVLKRCFLSCIIFPRGSQIHVDEIIRTWTACGYLNSRDNIVEKGWGYFRKLATRLFFQKLESDENDEEEVSFKVHDVMYDFAISLSNNREYNFIMDAGFEIGESSSSQSKCWNSIRKIRTFYVSNVSEEELQLDHLEHVRVLIMNGCELSKLPEEVGKLIHLRLLDLSSHWDIVELPEFVCDLYNLETLVLTSCGKLSKLPKRMDKFKKLRHILNEGTVSLTEFPQRLEKLTELWKLSWFCISKASDFGILSNLNQLQGTLYIKIELESNNAHNLEEVTGKANLKDKTQLKHLKLLFKWDEQMNDVVDALQPPLNLQHLTVYSDRSQELSRWIDTTSFNSLKVVTFNSNVTCPNLPPFNKLPVLEKLVIKRCGIQSLKLEEFFEFLNGVQDAITIRHEFRKLKILEINWYEWEEWEDIKGGQYSTLIIPFFKKLSIDACIKLEASPHGILEHIAASLHSSHIQYLSDSDKPLRRRIRLG